MRDRVVSPQAQEALRTFRAALKKAGGQYLLGSFSYADILLAILLQGLCSPGQPRKCAPPSLRRSAVCQDPRPRPCKPSCCAEHAFEQHASAPASH